MYLPIDADSGIPIYRQIADALRFRILSGRLAPGDRMPSIRDLCSSLRVNPATVNKAYRELELDGWLVTRRGLGTFVADSPPLSDSRAARDLLAASLDELAARAARLGLSEDELVRLVRARYRALAPRSARASAEEKER